MRRNLLRQAACLAVFLTWSTQGLANPIVTDEFVSSPPDPSVWTFVNPLGDGQHVVSGGQLSISVPAGVSHDPWTQGNDAPRLMQSVVDQDFAVEIKLDSSVTQKYQMHGLMVEEDADTFIRAEVFSDGSRTRVYAAVIDNGSVSTKVNLNLGTGVGAPIYLRLSRTADTWTYEYSLNGNTWQTATTFTAQIRMSAIGVHAGNHSSGSSAPAHTAVFDYFKNLAAPPPGPSYTLTTTVIGQGAVTLNPPGGTYPEGTVVELTAIPDPGWQFDSWSDAATGSANPVQVTVNSDLAVQALFSQLTPEYDLTVTTSGSGSVSLNPPGGTYPEGTAVELTAMPDAGWQFDGWSGAATGSTNPVQVTVNSDLAVQANFSQVTPDYNLTVTTSGSGSVNLNPAGGTYPEGTVVELTAVPDAGWAFDSWSGAATGSANPVQVTVNSDLAVQALFSQLTPEYDLTVTTSGSGSVSLNPPGGTYPEGTAVELTAMPDAGWQFDGWSGAATGSTNPVQVTVNSDLAVQANFSQVTPDYNLTVTTSGSGSVNLNPAGGTYPEGTVVELTAVPDAGWAFDSWSGAATGSTNPVQVTVNSDLAVQALFSQLTPEYDLTVTTSGSGSVSLNPPGGTYPEGTAVELTAMPDAGWQFDGWSGAATGSTNPVQVTVNSDLAVQANFSQVTPDYNLTVTTSGSGSVNLNPAGGTYPEGTVVELTAVPDAGWTFDSWSGDVIDVANPISVTVNSDLGISATFTPDQSAGGIVTDEFLSSPDLSVWTFVNPLGDGQHVVSGGQLSISVPAGVSHDLWTDGNDAPRLMQSVIDQDFAVEIKLDSSVTQKYQMQGLLVEEDADTFVRAEVFSDGSRTRVYSAVIDNGSVSTKVNLSLGTGVGAPIYLRLSRTADTWTYEYSLDGNTWQTATTFTAQITMSAIGVHAGNHSSGSSAPAHTAVFDYFKNLAAPPPGPSYTLTTTVSGQGAVSLNPPGGTYSEGTVVELTAVPDSGWAFDSWSGAATGSTNPVQVTVNSDLAVQALFVDAPDYDLTVTTSGSGSVSLNPPGGTYAEGTVVELTAVPDSGWQFDSWSGAATGSTNPVQVTVVSDLAVQALFVDAPDYDLTVTTSGSGSVSLNPPGGTYAEGTVVELTAVPDAGWAFDSWSGAATGSTNPVQVTVDSDLAVQALFVDVPDFNLAVTTSGSGSVILNPPGGTYTDGTLVELTAVPDSGWQFVGWSGAATGSTNPVQVTMDSDLAVNASFSVQTGSLNITNISVIDTGPTTARVTWTTNQAATSEVDYGIASTLVANASDSSFTQNHSVDIDWLRCEQAYTIVISSSTSSGTQATSQITHTTSACWNPGAGLAPDIDIWDEGVVVFGDRGEAQRWVNVRGRVATAHTLTSLSYSLNGGAHRPLSVGPDFRRLSTKGDFNVEIDYAELVSGLNNIEVRAQDSDGRTTVVQTNVDYVVTAPPELPYTTYWGDTADVESWAYAVDGNWVVSNGQVSADTLDYDRLLVIGDVQWTDYEVTVPVTVNELGPHAYHPYSNSPVVGFALRWPGHTPLGSEQPSRYWFPTGALAWYRWGSGQFALLGNNNTPADYYQGFELEFGVTYIFKLQVSTVSTDTARYRYKVWKAIDPEPQQWQLEITYAGGPTSGSILLIAHHADAKFGVVDITAPSTP